MTDSVHSCWYDARAVTAVLCPRRTQRSSNRDSSLLYIQYMSFPSTYILYLLLLLLALHSILSYITRCILLEAQCPNTQRPFFSAGDQGLLILRYQQTSYRMGRVTVPEAYRDHHLRHWLSSSEDRRTCRRKIPGSLNSQFSNNGAQDLRTKKCRHRRAWRNMGSRNTRNAEEIRAERRQVSWGWTLGSVDFVDSEIPAENDGQGERGSFAGKVSRKSSKIERGLPISERGAWSTTGDFRQRC